MNNTTISQQVLLDSGLEAFREAVNEVIRDNHARGLPVYQLEGDYIIALYPGNRKVKLEKVKDPETEIALWRRLL